MGKLDGKVALITGGNGGIGRETAKLFAEEGAKIVIVDLKRDEEHFNDVANEIIKNGGEAIAVHSDVTSTEDCQNAFKSAVEKFGHVDILINAAGVTDFFWPTARVSDDYWQKVLNINLTGVFLFCREGLKYFTEQGHGTIVNLSAIAGIKGNAGVCYSATKHGVIGITQNIAMQYVGTDIRCNALCPGATATNMMGSGQGQADKEMWEVVARYQADDKLVPPMNPLYQAKALLFLASDDSIAITGQAIISDRGKFL